MDNKHRIAMVVRENWPHLKVQFSYRDEAPSAASHKRIQQLLTQVSGGSATKQEERRFRQLVGDPSREFGDLRLDDYRCQLTLTDAGGTPDKVRVYQVVCHSWEGVLEFCLSARRIPQQVKSTKATLTKAGGTAAQRHG